jgi:hypothetical protein
LGHTNNVSWQQLFAVDFNEASILLHELDVTRVSCHLSNTLIVANAFDQARDDGTRGNYKNADSVETVSVPPPQGHAEHLKDVEWV